VCCTHNIRVYTHSPETCSTLQHTATRNLQYTATYCNTKHALHCNILQHETCITLQFKCANKAYSYARLQCAAVCCSVLQRVAACCSVRQCVAVDPHDARHCSSDALYTGSCKTHCTTLKYTIIRRCNTLQHAETHCNTLQHAERHCNNQAQHC